MDYNIKSIKEEFKKRGVFYTPPELAEMIKSYTPKNIIEVYDPTCGDGGLLKVFDDSVKKYGQEIDKVQCDVADEMLINKEIVCGDTLEEPAFRGKKFDCIVANPPFSIKWNPKVDERFEDAPTIPTKGRADYAFILHILYYLSDDGIAVVLGSPGILYRGNREYKIRRWIIEQNYIEKIALIPGDTFVDTAIPTVIIVFNKHKKDTSIEFEDKALKKKKIVTLEEVETNDYGLSVSNYIQEDIIKEDIDPIKMNEEARIQMIKKLENDIKIDLLVCEFEKIDKVEYINILINKLEQIKLEI